jgi:serine/threonine protein kinase
VPAACRLFLKVYESKSPPPMDKAVLDPQLYSLLTDCFTREPENRPSAAQLKKHSFMQQSP